MSVKQEVAHRRLEIRKLLRSRKRAHEIAQGLGISQRTLYRDLQAIRTEDKEWLECEVYEQFSSSYRLTIERLEDRIQALLTIADKAKDDFVRIKANVCAAELETSVHNLLAEGPNKLQRQKTDAHGRKELEFLIGKG